MIYPIVLLTANRQTVAATFKTQIAALATTGALQRFSVTEYQIGAADVPNATDCPIEWDLARATADGTGTAYGGFTDGFETGTQAASNTTRKQGYSAEPTITASVMVHSGSMNQRGFFRFVAMDQQSEPRAPAVAASGFALRALSTNYRSTMSAQLNIRE